MYCVECLYDKHLIEILENIGSQLISLSLGGYMALPNRITDESIKHVFKNCKQLNEINFELLSATSTFDSLMPYFEQIKYANKFEVLSFSACRNISKLLLTKLPLFNYFKDKQLLLCAKLLDLIANVFISQTRIELSLEQVAKSPLFKNFKPFIEPFCFPASLVR